MNKSEYDIQRLGGERAYKLFTKERFNDKKTLKLCLSLYPKNNLYIYGNTGVGKTHLAVSLIREIPFVRLYKPQDILRKCRFCETPQEEAEAINYFINKEHFVIDDLGVDKTTETSFSILYEIIDGRYMYLKSGIIITSNLSLAALSDKMGDDRISSRLSEMCKIIKLSGKDRRIGGNK